MTPQESDAVRGSWRCCVLPRSEKFSQLFYGRLFELDPSLRGLFPEDTAALGRKIMLVIDMAVASIDHIDILETTLSAGGRRHHRYGVCPHHYGLMRDALLWTVREMTGTRMGPELEAGWSAVYDRMAELMKKGAHAAVA